MLNDQEKTELLKLARRAVELRVRGEGFSFAEAVEPGLRRPGGAFVTLHRHGELRGCIGRILSQDPLFLTVQEMAIAAATQDWRFSAVRVEELPELHFEVSALTAPKVISGLEEIQVGRDGL